MGSSPLIATKVARLGVLLNSDNPAKNESIDDSILDLANYSVLLGMILSEDPKTEYILLDGIPLSQI